jgi:hypothetical protein
MMIKSLAKHLPHPLLLRLHHHYDLARKSALARMVSWRTGLPLLERLELPRLKTSDTVFVLGSGSSINNISDKRWEVIGRHDTIALNFWPVHTFLPRIYLFESIYRVEGYELMFDRFQDLLQRRAGDYQNVTKIVSELQPLGPRQLLFEIPEGFRSNLYVGYSTCIAARSEGEFIAGIRYLRRRGNFEPGNYVAWHFKCGGSVIAAMSLAARMNYRRLVLCGIDLGKAEYFYQDSERYPETCHWEFAPRSQPHLTARRYEWGLPAQEAIYHFKREILDAAGIELFVENRSSTLFPQIPDVSPQLFEQLAESRVRHESLRR